MPTPQLERTAESVLRDVAAAQDRLRMRLLVRDSPPIWKAEYEGRRPVVSVFGQLLSEELEQMDAFARMEVDRLIGILALAVLLWIVLRLLARPAGGAGAEDESLASAARILSRPVSASVLIWLLVSIFQFRSAPLLLMGTAAVLLAVSMLRILPGSLATDVRWPIYGLSAWFGVEMIRQILVPEPIVARSILLVESLAAVVTFAWLLRPARLTLLGHPSATLRATARHRGRNPVPGSRRRGGRDRERPGQRGPRRGAARGVVNNFVSGLILLFERPIQQGDTVEVEGMYGDVRRIGLRSSTLRTFDGSEVVIPNSRFVSQQFVNWTLSDRQRRVDLPVGVAYGTDPERVIGILLEVAAAHGDVLKFPAPTAFFCAFGASSLDFELRVWLPRFEDWLRVRSDLGVALIRALQEAGIEIPFPQRDLHLRSVSAEPAAGAPGETRRQERDAP